MIKRLTRHFSAQTQSLREVYKWTKTWCNDLCMKETVLNAFLLSVYEASCNVVEHSYENMETSVEFSITLLRSPKAAIAIVENQGRRFDIDMISPPDFSEKIQDRKVGGLGLHFIRTMMDRVLTREKKNNANQLIMIKYLPPSSTSNPQ